MNKNLTEINIKGGELNFKLKGSLIFGLKIPANVIDNMEVLDPLELEKIIRDAIKVNNIIPTKVNLTLSNEIIFNKIIASPEDEKKFFDEIPIEPEDLIKETVLSGKDKIAIAINNKFTGDIKNILEKVGFSIEVIVPEVESIQNLIDFNNKNSDTQDGDNKKTSNSALKVSLIGLGVVGLIAIVLFFFIKKPLVKIEIIGQTPSPVPQTVETPTPLNFLDKENIQIQILNKTTTAGLAKKVSLAIPTFPNIEIGNINGKETQITDIIFTNEISETIRTEIFSVLQNMFNQVASDEAELANGYDVLIELGNPD